MSHDSKEGSLSRRDFVRTAALIGTIAGAGTAKAASSGATCSQVPSPRHSRSTTPFVIESELGEVVEGLMDLTTVERERTNALLDVDLHLDRLREEMSVMELTDKIEKLALVDPELHRPPTVRLTWGTGLTFKGIIEQVHTSFTAFKPDGTPVRAVVNVSFQVLSECDFDRVPPRE
jgi:hypothetical protein